MDQKPSRALRVCVDADPNVLPLSSLIVTVPLLPDGELIRPPMLPFDVDTDGTVELGTGVTVVLADSNAVVVADGVAVGVESGITVTFDDTFAVGAGVILAGAGALVGVTVDTIVSDRWSAYDVEREVVTPSGRDAIDANEETDE